MTTAISPTAPPRLAALEELLITGPPSIHGMILRFRSSASMVEFQALIRKYLPDQVGTILNKPDLAGQLSAFANIFEENYFPLLYIYDDEFHLEDMLLNDDDPEYDPLSQLLHAIPFQPYGLDYDDAHDMWQGHYDTGLLLLALVSELPFEELRVSWIQGAREHVSDDVLRPIAQKGYDVGVLLQALKGTDVQGVIDVAEWFSGMSDNIFLGCPNSPDYFNYSDPWTDEMVEAYTVEWRYAKQVMDRAKALGARIMLNPDENFKQLLKRVDFLVNQSQAAVQAKTLVEVLTGQ